MYATVIILYEPSEAERSNVSRFAQANEGVLIDNSSAACFQASTVGRMRYVWLGGNKGIAAAQNEAVRLLLSEGKYEQIVFLDQDSRVDSDYPEKIVKEMIRAAAEVGDVGIIGPLVVNRQSDEVYSSSIHKDRFVGTDLVERGFIISSGSCVSASVLQRVGLADDRLFIDYVDSEWCWRARAKGYRSVVTCRVRMSHQVGRRLIHIGPFRDIVSAPFRYEYQFRNYLWLLRRQYVPRAWKVATGIKFAIRLFYLPWIKNGLSSWRYAWKGICKGLTTSTPG